MSAVSDLASDLLKSIGENAENPAVTEFIDTGFAPLNENISGDYDGGLPYGRLGEMFGPSSSGKTALATKWMVQAQKMGGCAIFIDWERSFNVELAKDLGLTDKMPFWIYKKPKTWEEGNTVAASACEIIRRSGAIKKSAPILVVLDSIASALPKSMTDKGIDEYTMNDTTALARVTSTTLKSMAQWAEEFNATFLYLNQIRMKPGVVYGDPRTTPGGQAMEFYSTFRLALGRKKIVEKTTKEFLGQEITIQCVKSKLTKPFKETTLKMMFREDGTAYFDEAGSLLDLLIDSKKIAMSGARVQWIDGKSYYKAELLKKIEAEGLVGKLNEMFKGTAVAATATD